MPTIPDSKKLREARVARGLTCREVQDQTGISDSTIRNLEKGRNKNPKLDVLDKLADFYGFSHVSEILTKGDRGGQKRRNRKERPKRA